MNSKLKKIIIIVLILLICTGGLFIYEVKKEHHYTPQTAEIVFDNAAAVKDAFILKDSTAVKFDLSEHIKYVSDVENGTANLTEKKKVFGFYECDINYVYDDRIKEIYYYS